MVDDEVVWSGDITLNYNAEVGYLERKDPRRMTFPGAVPAKAILYIYKLASCQGGIGFVIVLRCFACKNDASAKHASRA